MMRFLLTWYGITDLRASLGFEASGGPILAALMTRDYSHVLILAYTDPAKPEPAPTHASPVEAVDAFANTPAGHDRFREWLHREIRQRELGISMRVVPKVLASLNDSKGIYEAAAESLDIVLAVEGEKELTLFLSPGTPVMAFTWAFVALLNPELKLRVIASPEHRRPPVEVLLPYELLDPSSRKRRRVDPVGTGGFDTVFHLFGEQRLPGLLGVLQFPSQRHVFVSSPRFPAGCMRGLLPAGASFAELHVDPFDPMSTHREIIRAAASLPAGERVGFNLTGGTKLMFVGAQSACRRVGGVPFYFEVRDHSLVFLDDFSTMEVRGVENVEKFIELGGFSVSRRGRWSDHPVRERRRRLTDVLWRERRRVAKLYAELSDLDRRTPGPFCIEHREVAASLDGEMRGRVRLGDSVHVIEDCPDFAAYLCGGWLEEYVFALLEPSLRDGNLRDLRIGLEVSWSASTDGIGQRAAQEFDVALTDGRRLVILECKAGKVLSEDIYKLENSVRKYGGVEARGVLLAAFPPTEASQRRLEGSKNLSWLHGEWVSSRLVGVILDALGGVKPTPLKVSTGSAVRE